MKQCTACRTTYTDETLRYCLADGAVLVEVDGDVPTVVTSGISPVAPTVAMNQPHEQMRVDIPPPSAPPPPVFQQATPPPQRSSGGGLLKILIAVVILGILALIAVGVAGFVYYNMSRGDAPAANANKEVKPTPAPSATKEDNDELRDQIANLEKLLKEQKSSGQPSNSPIKMPDASKMTSTARANSPSDGFLALRSLPSSDVGARITKIPHGATVSIGICGPVVTPVKRSGRWCQASYGGYTGWVFDAYLIY
ncbi:hypothetical protein BH10ACI3_BH10ACI3_18840 [soil metagenome]